MAFHIVMIYARLWGIVVIPQIQVSASEYAIHFQFFVVSVLWASN